MRRRISILLIFVLWLNVTPLTAWSSTKNITVTLPTFEVRLNGIQIDNENRKYPLIVYKDITYFPMTYEDSRFLGLKTEWDEKNGLRISKSQILQGYTDDSEGANKGKYTATIPQFSVQVNSKTIDNEKETYPLLLFRNITYFPLTWRFAVNEFGWEYKFTTETGLEISTAKAPQVYSVTDVKLPIAIREEGIQGTFTVAGAYFYYEGDKGVIYQSPIHNPNKAKAVYQLPLHSYGVGDTYVYAGLKTKANYAILTYHQGGAIMGADYMIKINEDGTNEVLDSGYFNLKEFEDGVTVRVNQGVPPSQNNLFIKEKGEEELKHVGDTNYIYGWIWTRDKESQGGSPSQDLYMIGDDIYILAYFKPGEVYGTTGIHKVNINTGETKRISDHSTKKFQIHGDAIYFLDLENYLYKLSIDQIYIERLLDFPVSDFIILDKQLYYVTEKDRGLELYKLGDNVSINRGETFKTVTAQDEYIICTFDKEGNSPYKMMILNKEGNVIFKTTKNVQQVKIHDGKIYYIK